MSASTTSIDANGTDRRAAARTGSTGRPPHVRFYEAAFRRHGLDGGVGDRDTFRFRGFYFTVQEGQAVWEQYETFRIYLYDDAIGIAEPLDLRTPKGCVAFTNPMVEVLDVDGEPAMVVTAFVPGEAGLDCEAGPMLYVQRLTD